MGNFRNSSFFLFLPITLLKNVRFWTIIPFWKPQAIYLLVLSRKMAKNFQKYRHQGTEVKNPKFDQPHAGMCIFFILASNLVFNLKILSEYPYVNFWVLFALDFNLWGSQKSKKLEKMQKNGKKWKNPVNWQFFHQFCPPTAYFQWMIDDSEVLHPFTAFWIPKNWFLGQKWEILNIWKFSNLPHFWGSGALIMLPQGQEDVCVQRGTPDDDFEYWTATVPRLGAEIWAAKVFRSKTKNSGKGISIIWIILMYLYHQNGTQWHQLISYGKQWSLWSFWGHLTGKQLVLSLKLLKNTTEKAKIRQTWNRPFFRANLSYKLPSKD